MPGLTSCLKTTRQRSSLPNTLYAYTTLPRTRTSVTHLMQKRDLALSQQFGVSYNQAGIVTFDFACCREQPGGVTAWMIH